jgi:polysaccharide pyruvyl transferase CsaB
MGRCKKVVLSGYYGFENVGDEAVLASIIQDLKKEMPDIQITVLSHSPQKTEITHGVKAINRWKPREIIAALKKSDLLISGGGSLLQDTTSNKTIPYYLGIIQLAIWLKKPVVCYSQGVGPIQHNFNRRLTRYVLNQVNHIFVREVGSLKTLQDMGVQVPITVAIDPVLGIRLKPKVVQTLPILPSNAIGIYIRPWVDSEKVLDVLQEVGTRLIAEGYPLYAISMHGEEDRKISQKLSERLDNKLTVLMGSGDGGNLTIDEVVAYTAQFKWIIGMRLHSLIMAAALKVPMIALAYDPKVKDFMKQMNNKYLVEVENLKVDNLQKLIDDLLTNYEIVKQQIYDAYEKQKSHITAPTLYIHDLLK